MVVPESLSVASSVDEEQLLCIVRDFCNPSVQGTGGKHILHLKGSTLAKQAANDIARGCGYKENTVSVHYEPQPGGNDDIVLETVSISLSSLCQDGPKRPSFAIHEVEGITPERIIPEKLTEGADRSGLSVALPSPPKYIADTGVLIKAENDHIGLVNQAMTCYLNSLLQTLYMTPEFRNALYRWNFKGTAEEAVKSIPYQLQRLFLQLQTSKKKAAETTDLTRSFGWDSSEVWQQHDVQELCRVMFDALEQNWKNTGQANLINQLYQGKMKDYVKCLECSHESARVDAYLDIPLVIKPFGSTETYDTVEKAMNAFVQPETLDGSNQYFCEKCNKKCDAHKGLKFISFPYLLTLQLKRFDFDYATMHRIKLNDRMSFPERLDLNSFITADNTIIKDQTEEDVNTSNSDEKEEITEQLNRGQTDSSDEGIDEGIELENSCCTASSSSSESSSVSSEAAANNSRNLHYSHYKGKYEYELFSIMIHSGSAAGGHYYAYIKSFTDGQWFSFNDQQVSKITLDDIKKTFGGSIGRGFYSSAYTSSTSAYMLMYRRIDRLKNSDFIEPEDFPEALKAELQHQKEKEEAERRQRELDKCTCKIKLYCFHPTDQHKMDVRLEIHKDKTLTEATLVARELLGLESFVSPSCCRLVKYDEYQDSLEKSWEGDESTPIGDLLGGVKASYTFDLLLETKKQEQIFQEYKPGGVTVKVHVVDIHRCVIHPPVSTRAYHIQTVKQFKENLLKIVNCPVASMRCVLEKFQNELRPLTEPNRTLKAEGFYKSHKVFVECSGDSKDCSVPYSQSLLCQLLDRYQHTIHISCHLPSRKSLSDYITRLKENPGPAGCSSLELSAILPICRSTDSSQLDEGISEHDSAFYSRGTNSKHSLSAVDPDSNFSISSSNAAKDSRFDAGIQSAVSENTEDDQDSSFFKSQTLQQGASDYDESQSSSGIGDEGSAARQSSISLPHSSSLEQLSVDMVNLYSKLSVVGLQSSHSDPSVYHSCADNSDSSMQCLGSGPSSSSQDDTSISAEFSFNYDRPDPEPILSSPEDTFEDEGVGIDGGGTLASTLAAPLSHTATQRPDLVTQGLDLTPNTFSDNYSQFKCTLLTGGYDDSDDWDREMSADTQKEWVKQGADQQRRGGVIHSYPSSSSLHKTGVGEVEELTEGIEVVQGLLGAEGLAEGVPEGLIGEEEFSTNLETHSEHAISCTNSSGKPGVTLDSNSTVGGPGAFSHPPPPPPPPPIPPSLLQRTKFNTPAVAKCTDKNNEVEGEKEEVKRYFSAVISDSSEIEDRILEVSVDKRITLGAFKQELEPFVGVVSNFFKVYRVYSNNQEFESIRLSDTLSFFEDGKFNIKLGRALQPGEHRVKVFQLCVSEPEPCKFLLETIFAKDMTVLESKKVILGELKEQGCLDITLDRCRLRKKSWTNPTTVYRDDLVYETDIAIYPNWEIFLEVLDEPEKLLLNTQLAVYVRQWHPSTHIIDPFREVVLGQHTVQELKSKISELIDIPVENVEFAKGKGTFPCEVSLLEINNLEWNPHVATLNMWPLYICDDGNVVYFRDSREEKVEMSEEKKKSIQQNENKNSRQSHRVSCLPRKERALKIYTDDDDPKPLSDVD